MLDLVDKTLHQMPLPVKPSIILMRVLALLVRRNDWRCPLLNNPVSKGFSRITAICDHVLTRLAFQQDLCLGAVMALTRRTLVANIVAVAKLAKVYELPIVLSTVNVKNLGIAPTIAQLVEVLVGIEAFDRTSINAVNHFCPSDKAKGNIGFHVVHLSPVWRVIPQRSTINRYSR